MTLRTAVIGTGAIGSAVTRRLLATGHDVRVWNRTAARASPLITAGASGVRSVREALTTTDLALLALTDYAAVHRLTAGLDADLTGRTVVVLTTGTPDDARVAGQRFTGLGADYLDAGVQTSPEAIGTDTATILYGGSRAAFDRHVDTLAALSTPRFAGDTPEAAALWDLTLFGVWYDGQLGLLRALDTARAAGIDPAAFAETAATQLGHVVAGVPGVVAELARREFPRGPADLGEHLTVVRHLIGLRAGHHLGDGGLPVVAARLGELIAEGRGGDGLTATVG